MIKAINAFEFHGGTNHNYMTVKIDNKMMVMFGGGTARGKGRYVMLEDGSIQKIEKFGASKRMSYLTHETIIQALINDTWTIINKNHIMTPIAELINDLPEFTIIKQIHVSFTKFDENHDRKASIKKAYLETYIK